MRRLDLIVVPYEVERDDSPMARAPRALVEAGFGHGLRRAGFSLHESEIRTAADGREAVVADVAHRLARAVVRSRAHGRVPLVLSGGCLAGVGIVAGLQRAGGEAGVLWVDAHGDFNTAETSTSGYWDGMALAVASGRALPEIGRRLELTPLSHRRIVHVGGRNLDPPELEAFARHGVLRVASTEVATPGTRSLVAERFAGAAETYFHVDLDGLDPADAPAVNMAEPDGVPAADLAALFTALPPPSAMTLSAMNFDAADEPRRRATVACCLRLVRAAAAGAST